MPAYSCPIHGIKVLQKYSRNAGLKYWQPRAEAWPTLWVKETNDIALALDLDLPAFNQRTEDGILSTDDAVAVRFCLPSS